MTDGAPRVERDGDVVRITMTRAAKRNALSREHLTQLLAAVTEVGDSDATGIVLAAEGPVFSAGHDFADVAGAPLPEVRSLLELCTELMQTIQDVPQVVRRPGARAGHRRRLPAGRLLRPRGRRGVGRVRRSRAARAAGSATPRWWRSPATSAASGRWSWRSPATSSTPATALDWGLVNRVVPDDELDEAVDDLMARATRGSRASKAWGKQTMYAQLDRPERDAYGTAIEVMAAASQLPGAREGMAAFLEKRAPVWPD